MPEEDTWLAIKKVDTAGRPYHAIVCRGCKKTVFGLQCAPGLSDHKIELEHQRTDQGRIDHTLVLNTTAKCRVAIVYPGEETGDCHWHGKAENPLWKFSNAD